MRGVSFSRLCDDVLALYGPSMRAATTRLAIAQTLTELAEVPGVKRSIDLTPGTIARWIEMHPGRSPARTRSLLSNIRVICNIAVASGWLAVSPFSVRKLKDWVRPDTKAKKTVRHKSADQVATLLARADEEARDGSWATGRLQALLYVYVYTGLRAQEALHILAANVNLPRRSIVIEPLHLELPDGRELHWRPKTVKSARPLPMAEPLFEVLRLWRPRCGSPWLFPGRRLTGPWRGGPGYKPLDEIKKLGRRAGIGEDLTILGLRKSVGTHAKAMGLGGLEVAAIFGHTNLETQAHYDEERVESLRPAMAKIASYYAASPLSAPSPTAPQPRTGT